MGNEESRVIRSTKEEEDQSGQYAKECGGENAGWISCCTANSNRRQKFCNQESMLEEELLLHVSCYEYEVCIIRRIGVSIKLHVPPLHGSVHPCNGSSREKQQKALGTSSHIYFSKYIFCRCPARSLGVLSGYERQRGCRRVCPFDKLKNRLLSSTTPLPPLLYTSQQAVLSPCCTSLKDTQTASHDRLAESDAESHRRSDIQQSRAERKRAQAVPVRPVVALTPRQSTLSALLLPAELILEDLFRRINCSIDRMRRWQ